MDALFRSLSARLLFLLTVALLPLGLIAVIQTLTVISKVETLSRRDILSSTTEAAAAQIGLIRQAHGAAYAMGAMAVEIGPEDPQCPAILSRFIESDPRFVFAGFIRTDGQMVCASNRREVDFSGTRTWEAAVSDPRPRVTVNREGQATGLSVMISSVPIRDDDGTLVGVSSISIPHSLSDLLFDRQIEGLEVAIVNSEGEILSASTGIERSYLFEALGIVPGNLDIPPGGLTIDATDDSGAVSIVPLVGEETFIVGTWTDRAGPLSIPLLSSATLFPVVMWAASLFVAFFALQRLVLRHLKELRRHMRGFSVSDLHNSYVRLDDAPSEIDEIAQSYNALLDRITEDTERLEITVEEKEMLLKEVHHRVKNNLQLIASILNMQLRQIDKPGGGGPAATDVLRRVQDRVMSLATIHKLLYSEARVDSVRADTLVSEIIGSAVNMGSSRQSRVETRVDLAPVALDPDRAVPLALLVTEAVTNALKNVGAASPDERFISVTLSEEPPGELVLEVVNSCAPDSVETIKTAPPGLGSRLIQAFVSQLDGTCVSGCADGRYTLVVRFPTAHRRDGATAAEAREPQSAAGR